MTCFTLPPLPYGYSALEPYIDTLTMQIHHNKHHKSYVDNLNKALAPYPELCAKPIDELMESLNFLPEAVREDVRKYGGGHYNHSFFWPNLSPYKQSTPSGQLLEAIYQTFGSYEEFTKEFKKTAMGTFGSGWTWLVKDFYNQLSIISTANQDTPLELGFTPIMVIDLWEHAYYLKYQNRRDEYIDAFFHIVNWPRAQQLYLFDDRVYIC